MRRLLAVFAVLAAIPAAQAPRAVTVTDDPAGSPDGREVVVVDSPTAALAMVRSHVLARGPRRVLIDLAGGAGSAAFACDLECLVRALRERAVEVVLVADPPAAIHRQVARVYGLPVVARGAAPPPAGAAAPVVLGPPRASPLPLIDLAADTARQVVVDREEGQYLGHPTTVLLEDGATIVCVYPKGHGRGAIVMKRSTDGGLTWSARLPVPASWATSQEVPTIHRVVDRDGTRRLILFSGLYPIRMAVSVDDGARWSELEPIGAFGGVVTMASVARMRNGDYLAFFHDDGRFLRAGGKRADPVRFVVYATRSTDGGLTWGEPEVVTARADAHLCEPGFVRSPDGDTIALLLRENSRRHNGFVVFSTDEGTTWSEPRELPSSLTGDRHTARYAPDGRLLVTFRDTALISATAGDWVAWVGTWDDLAAGRDGRYRVRLMDNHHGSDCAYPGLELLPDGTFVTTTYGHWTPGASPYVVSVRLRLDEVDALAER